MNTRRCIRPSTSSSFCLYSFFDSWIPQLITSTTQIQLKGRHHWLSIVVSLWGVSRGPLPLCYDFDWAASCPLETSCWARANGLLFWILSTSNTWSYWGDRTIYKGMVSSSWRLVSRLNLFLIERRRQRRYSTPNNRIVEMDFGRSKISATNYSAQGEHIIGDLCGGLHVVCLCFMANYCVVKAGFLS